MDVIEEGSGGGGGMDIGPPCIPSPVKKVKKPLI